MATRHGSLFVFVVSCLPQIVRLSPRPREPGSPVMPGADETPRVRPGQGDAAEPRPEAASASRPKTVAEIEFEAEEHFSKVDWWLREIADRAVARAVARKRDEFFAKLRGDDPKVLMCRDCEKYFPFPYAFSVYYLMVWTARTTAAELAHCKICRKKRGMKTFEEEIPGQGPLRFDPVVVVASSLSPPAVDIHTEERVGERERSEAVVGDAEDEDDDDGSNEEEDFDEGESGDEDAGEVDDEEPDEDDEDEDDDEEDDDEDDDEDEEAERIALIRRLLLAVLAERRRSSQEAADSGESEDRSSDDDSPPRERFGSNKCNDCDGDSLGFGNGVCSHCHGNGYEPYSLLPGGIESPCRRCGGSGICRTCGGAGAVY